MAGLDGDPGLSLQTAREEAARCLFCFDAPCVTACPTGIDVPGFIRAIATGNLDGSARTILAANPLGGTCARVCPVESLCEGACVRVALDRAVPIGALQRVAMDAYRDAGRPFFPAGPATGKRVAVVGAGPAGLACSAELRRQGIDVTIFEARTRAGGLCAYGIVPWRHAREMTAHEVAEVERAGALIRRGTRVGKGPTEAGGPTADGPAADGPTAAELIAGFDAVFLGMGLGRSRRPGVPGEGLDGVFDALTVLEPVVTGEAGGVGGAGQVALGPRVGVIGGGSTAMDAAAAAVQLGAEEVTIFYRRGESEAPAYPHAIELARSLGVRLHWLAAPVEFTGTDGRVSGAVFDRMRLGDPDRSGRATPHRVPGGRFTVELDSVIVATGQEALERLVDDFSVGARGGRVAVDPATGRTDNPRVWAGGDLVNGGREVVNAVQAGKLAARSIAAALGVPAVPARIEITAAPAADGAPAVSLAVDMAGIRSPNPFWLASGPPTNTGEMVARAFEAGWGGAVWKTVGEPITNVTSRLGSLDVDGRRMVGISNIELISDRPIETNLAEIREVKRRFPDRALVVSLMVESTREAWHDIVRRVNDTGADGIELNCGCPHGMAERGMGSAVGQVPEYLEMITGWAKEASAVPVLVKLTPNITDITVAARAARQGGADGIALINTISSLVGLDLETWETRPAVRGRGSHGGYSGPAVKPIALNMVSAIGKDPRVGIPISGVGGVETWRDAVEFMLVGATTVQVCTGVMHHGHRMVEDMIDGLAGYLAGRGLASPADLVGRALPAIGDWGQLDLSYKLKARIDTATCIHCNLCYRACEDGAHQAIRLARSNGASTLAVDDAECVGCRLCEYVCPVSGCITMAEVSAAVPVG
jgi:dihydropyrimidine dehydrogenase (NAD+) subunit PreA